MSVRGIADGRNIRSHVTVAIQYSKLSCALRSQSLPLTPENVSVDYRCFHQIKIHYQMVESRLDVNVAPHQTMVVQSNIRLNNVSGLHRNALAISGSSPA